MNKNRSFLGALATIAVAVAILSLWIASPDERVATPKPAAAAAASTPHAAWPPEQPQLYVPPKGPFKAPEGPEPETMAALGKALGTPEGLRVAKEHYLLANRYPPGVIRVTKDMRDLLQPNKLETVAHPVLGKGGVKPDQRLSVVFETGIARSIGKDPIPLKLAVFRGETEKKPDPVKVLTTKITRLDAQGADQSIGSFTLARGEAESMTGSWTPNSSVEGYNGILVFSVQWQVNGEEPQGSMAMLEYSDAEPAKFTGIAGDELVSGSLEVRVGVDVTLAGRYTIDARIFAADGTTPIGFAQATPTLQEGKSEVKLVFYGLLFHDAKTAGPYVVKTVTGYQQSSNATGGRGRQMRPLDASYSTAAYSLDQFTDKEWDSPQKQASLAAMDKQIAAAEKSQKKP